MKIGNLLIIITIVVAVLGFLTMFGMGLFYLDHTAVYGTIGIISFSSAIIAYVLLLIKD